MKVHFTPHCNEVFLISITGHPSSSKGIPKKVAYCGMEGNVLFVREHGLQDCEMPQIVEAVKQWRKDELERFATQGGK